MSSSFGCTYAPPNPEASAKLISIAEERGTEETGHESTNLTPTPDQQYQQNPHRHHHRHLSLQQNMQRPRRDPEPLDPNINPDQTRITISSNANPIDLPDASASTTAVRRANANRYRECQKNHAAHLGGHVLDGCGEFMSSGGKGTPESFKCAACQCHRNFHRKETDGKSPPPSTNCYLTYYPSKSITQKHVNVLSGAQPAPPILHQSPQPQIHQQHQGVSPFSAATQPVGPPFGPHLPTMVAFGGGATRAPAESSSEDLNIFRLNAEGQPSEAFGASKKRFRTKFSQEQKEKMTQFAEKLGWKIQNQDQVEVQQFCDEVGVKKRVFKVWMHNNKQARKRKVLISPPKIGSLSFWGRRD
ncbi:hypothetical protein Nepgr_008161 [Nepenthes gracilis]|uniref:ZF-HD dimerization-type domain-containing protein n=1 Tax=Nepenthes gracilis TaxID=150966 RepID=A0AAD3S936_NEPGR|nr:hypothetical protein Nepgr_008161 [Nepenthes gracilis]